MKMIFSIAEFRFHAIFKEETETFITNSFSNLNTYKGW